MISKTTEARYIRLKNTITRECKQPQFRGFHFWM